MGNPRAEGREIRGRSPSPNLSRRNSRTKSPVTNTRRRSILRDDEASKQSFQESSEKFQPDEHIEGLTEEHQSPPHSSKRRKSSTGSLAHHKASEQPSPNKDDLHDLPWYHRISKRAVFFAGFLGFLLGIYIVQSDRDWSSPDFQELLYDLTESLPNGSDLQNRAKSILKGSKAIIDGLLDSQMLGSHRVSRHEDALDVLLGFPGKIAKSRGWVPHFPVFMIPGMTSTGLELWQSQECCRKFFRDRLWGTTTMLRLMLTDSTCWMRHVQLDPCTGRDPEGIKLRAAQGLEAADFLMPGYWVWGKLIEAMADIGYDPNMLTLAAYDWRLGVGELERRDRYFTRLKRLFETSLESHNRKAVVLGHSLGSNNFMYFLNWVESEEGGNGGRGWVETHIDTFLSIGGPLLGLPKSVASLVSGEMKDTAQLGMLESFLVDSFLSKKERAALFQSWPCMMTMLPKGGDMIWGNSTHSADGPSSHKGLGQEKINPGGAFLQSQLGNVTASDLFDFLLHTPFLRDGGKAQLLSYIENDLKWTHPFHYQLPNAPSLKLYLTYGVGQSTERAYHYTNNTELLHFPKGPYEKDALNQTELLASCEKTRDVLPPCQLIVNTEVSDHTDGDPLFYTSKGVVFGDGDGTVPLLSSGYMAAKGWQAPSKDEPPIPKESLLNPWGVQVYLREYYHDPFKPLSTKGFHVRGGPRTADHVDILGNHDLTLDILQMIAHQSTLPANYTFRGPLPADIIRRDPYDLSKNPLQLEEDVQESNFCLSFPFLAHVIHSSILTMVEQIPRATYQGPNPNKK